MVFLNTTEILLGIAGIYFKYTVEKVLKDLEHQGDSVKQRRENLSHVIYIMRIAFVWILINLCIYALAVFMMSFLLIFLCCSGILDFEK